jgi:phosphate transport system permease protein
MTKQQQPSTIPDRFVVRPATLWFDRFMNYFITVGGLSIIIAVLLIFVFILLQVFPLFRGARVEPQASFPGAAGRIRGDGDGRMVGAAILRESAG